MADNSVPERAPFADDLGISAGSFAEWVIPQHTAMATALDIHLD
jgi:hypothetical protein